MAATSSPSSSGHAAPRGGRIVETLQELWSGYGRILRIELADGTTKTVIAKHVKAPAAARHPRGWNSDLSHERKVVSYQVETAFYRTFASQCDRHCRVPTFLAYEEHGGETLILLEDLDAAGYPARLASVEWRHIEICLRWLAHFHATFMGSSPLGLWKTGTYWHLETRPEELEILDDLPLKNAARAIDQRLSDATHQTLVHGDAKLANFCFADDGSLVAAVDFQYAGGGCGMKDVAYFASSCMNETECERNESRLLDTYFSALEEALETLQPALDPSPILTEWTELYPVAWTDFHRFLKGWSPGHWKITAYSERLARQVIRSL